MCRGAGVGRDVDGGDQGGRGGDQGGEGVGLQREMGLVSGISLIVGRPPLFLNWPMGYIHLSFSNISSIAKNTEGFSKTFLV